MIKSSAFFLPTMREEPAEAEVVSHRLMLRAGMIRKLAAGVYSLLPLGVRAIQRLERIIREEMNRAGAQEVYLPALQPAELWQQSGRWEFYGPELMRLKDRHERDFCLGPTHEEVITSLVAGEVRSYRQLPLNLYQIQTKFRDEIRPRFGVMRGREFSMKDAYSFDRDEAGAEESYRAMYRAYQEIFRRCGLRFKPVEADSGPIGGSFSHEFMVLAETGEDAVISCTGCSYAATMEKAELPPPSTTPSAEPGLPEKVATPGMRTVEEVCAFLEIGPERLVKTLIYRADGELVAVLVRGDRQMNEIKLKNYLKVNVITPSNADDIAAATGAPVGFAGPVGLKGVRILADQEVMAMGDAVTGANEADAHLRHVRPGRDFAPAAAADLRAAVAGDSCPRCGAVLTVTRGIEVGHVFKLGTKYSQSLGARFLDEKSQERLCIMGCYGIGVGRTVAAAVEQNHDQKGIIWPVALAPFPVTILSLKIDDPATMEVSERLARELEASGWEVLWDERDERPGVKFADAELTGVPLRVTVGPRSLKEGKVEAKVRRTGAEHSFPLAEAPAALHRLLTELAASEQA
jgi:prolyl-tRNA synthetase